ncbi:NAD-dependent epimerase/dehydratase family protein [Naasia aerilata]|uniref:NAD-dependent epimerase/dehydratase domain-containing protein n=1 Tax=Naasia aerilata TaxID=1162966 RepID=A0ABM8GB91_9MICO|nr:NAD-dependent epimerase/dehydratase family protein [Naasia aerilata]BDZ45497.1 hypothetical protein GCM10025866_14060 [Naasia aerilata]
MRVLITGGAGFLGDRLARTLLETGLPAVPGASAVDRVVLLDRMPAQPDLLADPRIRSVVGDAADHLPGALEDIDLVFHLAAVVSSEAERDFDLGMRVNLATTLDLLNACRRLPQPPRLVFASSLAVFGSTPENPFRTSSPTTPCRRRNRATGPRSSSASSSSPTSPDAGSCPLEASD